MRVTDKQRTVLLALAQYKEPPTTRQLADRLDRPRPFSPKHSYDEVYGHLRRLERDIAGRPHLVEGMSYRGLVDDGGPEPRREPLRWVLTDAGREYVEANP